MKTLHLIVASALCAALVSPVWADNDKNKGKGRDNDNDRGHSGRVEGGPASHTPTVIVVNDHERNTIHTYYRTEFVSGNCPPGLAKKENGCLPPGQAKKLWIVGQPLPPTIVYYPLPQPLMTQLAVPPMGYEYVRVDDDVLLMDRNTRLVSQIIVNLARLMN